MEAVPLVEQHPLRALEDHGAGAQEPVQVCAVHDGHRCGERGVGVDGRADRGHVDDTGRLKPPTSADSRSRSAASFSPQRRRVAAVRDPGRVVGVGERIGHRLAHPSPQDPCRLAPRAISRAWLAARWYGVASSAAPSTVSRSNASVTPDRRQPVGLDDQRQRVDHHETREVGTDTGAERAGAELGERVAAAVGQDDGVRRLPAPVDAAPPRRPGGLRLLARTASRRPFPCRRPRTRGRPPSHVSQPVDPILAASPTGSAVAR